MMDGVTEVGVFYVLKVSLRTLPIVSASNLLKTLYNALYKGGKLEICSAFL